MYGILARSVHRAISHINVTNPHLTSAQTSIHSIIPSITVAHICKAVDNYYWTCNFCNLYVKTLAVGSIVIIGNLYCVMYGYNLIRKSRSLVPRPSITANAVEDRVSCDWRPGNEARSHDHCTSSLVMVTCAGTRLQITKPGPRPGGGGTQQAKPHRVPRCPFQGNISRYWAWREVEGEADEIRFMAVGRLKYYPS